MTEYVIRVRPTDDGYRATLAEAAPGSSLDVRTLPTGVAAVGAAATAPAAILAAIISARIPVRPVETRRRPYAC